MDNNLVIGVLGGMGTYATVHLFQQYASIFKSEKEWDRPRIIIDNRCTMPSRVRAYLFNENVAQLIDEMVDSLKSLENAGCNRIILACNTAHLFLPKVYERLPELENKIVDIIDICIKHIIRDDIQKVYLIASEGTIESGVYQQKLGGVECLTPEKTEYKLIRECIEAVKQNTYSEEKKRIFVDLVNRFDSCILGCTELPILYEKYRNEVSCKNVYDPILLGIKQLKLEFEGNRLC